MNHTEFTFEHPSGIRISRDLIESDAASLAGVNKRDMGTGFVWYSLPPAACESGNLMMSLCFRSGHLDSLSIAMDNVDLGSGWSDWSEEKERTRAKRSEDWLADLGYFVGTHSWGEVWAGYDPKGGCGSAGIRYNRESGPRE